jgi:SAM-dependent methyltransferase
MEPYTKEYYEAINREEAPQAKAVAKKITEIYQPKSVIDLGCGTGLYLKEFECPVKIGVDNAYSALDCAVDGVTIYRDDLVDPIYPFLFRRYDVAICFEVLEHIEEPFAEGVVDLIVNTSDVVILTAAPPNQPGLNHVNCQPQAYWEGLFAVRGFKRNYLNEFWIAHSAWEVPHTLWMVRNLMVFER